MLTTCSLNVYPIAHYCLTCRHIISFSQGHYRVIYGHIIGPLLAHIWAHFSICFKPILIPLQVQYGCIYRHIIRFSQGHYSVVYGHIILPLLSSVRDWCLHERAKQRRSDESQTVDRQTDRQTDRQARREKREAGTSKKF